MKQTLISLLILFVLAVYPMPAQTPNHATITRTAYAASRENQDSLVVTPKTYTVWVTAYSSKLEETDDTPFITAHNTEVREGIIAANFLPFGTQVKIPKIFGNKIFIVEDRMHRRKKNFIDIWMPNKELAQNFGIHKEVEIVVVN